MYLVAFRNNTTGEVIKIVREGDWEYGYDLFGDPLYSPVYVIEGGERMEIESRGTM